MLTTRSPLNILELLLRRQLQCSFQVKQLATTNQLAKSLAVESLEKVLPDDPDGYDKQEFDIEPRKNAYYYKYEISKYARQGSTGLRRALELFQEMKAKSRLEPTVHNFSPLIYGCAKAGYTKRAFELYEESLKYVAKPTQSTITCLINACGETPFPEYGLKRLEWFLYHVKKEYGIVLNLTHYNCAIKAYGKLGRLDEASKLIQELLDNGLYPDQYTFNMLLMGCASNEEAGCSLALRVYKRMKLYQVQRSCDTYHLLLRCIRDCGLGSKELISETFAELPAVTSLDQQIKYRKEGKIRESRSSKRKFDTNFAWAPLFNDLGASLSKAIGQSKNEQSRTKLSATVSQHDHSKPGESKDQAETRRNLLTLASDSGRDSLMQVQDELERGTPNLLSDDHLDLLRRIEAIHLDKLKTPADRILLFGGLHGYLKEMMSDKCKPDTKTFTLILDCLEPSPENFMNYFKLSEVFKIKRDVLFYDLLLEKICDDTWNKTRLDLALQFLEDMQCDNLRPNISTFEALASGCNDWKQAHQLIVDLERAGLVVSDDLVKKLFFVAIKQRNFFYLNSLIEYSEQRGYRPTKHMVEKLEERRLEMLDYLVKQEKGLQPAGAHVYKPSSIAAFDKFRARLSKWLSNVDLQEEDHPWAQFKVESGSKRDGFMKFVKHLNAMEKLKQESLQSGRRLGNLSSAADRELLGKRQQ